MMLGLNMNLWSYALVEKAVSQFGKLLGWEEDHDNMARALVKVRVTGLDDIPWFFNFSDGESPESDNWTVQCEIISATMLGAQPQDEDFPPDDPDDIDPNHFEFFGYGQPGQGPQPPPNGPPDNNQLPVHNHGNPDWPQWPAPNTAQQMVQGQVVAQPDEPPLLIPLQEVEGHNGHVEDDLMMPVEEVIQNNQVQPPTPPLNDEEVLAMDDNTDTDSNIHPQAQLPIPLVEIVQFPVFNNMQPLMPEELDEEDALGWLNELDYPQNLDNIANIEPGHNLENNANLDPEHDQGQMPADVQLGQSQLQNEQNMMLEQNLEGNEQQNNVSQGIQLGFVHTFTPPVMPATLKDGFGPFPNYQKSAILNQDVGSSSSSGPSPMAIRCWGKYFASVDNGLLTVTVPAQWVNFFSLLMLKQGSYEWAKEFLSSLAWTLLQQHLDSFHVNAASSTEEETFPTQPSNAGSSDVHNAAEQSTPPPPSASCSTPPKGKRVRDLGTTFCSIDPAKLTDTNLNVKSQKEVIDKPKSKKPKLGKGSDVGPARKDKVSSKSTKKPNKDAKDARDPDTDVGPSMGTKN